MNFSQALEELKLGKKVARKGWGKGAFIYLVESKEVNIENLQGEAAKHFEAHKDSNRGKRVTISSHIDMKTADGSLLVGWTPSEDDMLADDWEIVFR